MTKTISLIAAFSICFFINTAFGEDHQPLPDSGSIYTETTDLSDPSEEEFDSNFWRWLWGKKARDAALLGMWSLHLDGTGEYFGSGSNNDQLDLVGLQFYGLSAGTFINSKDDRAWFFGPAREVYSRNFSEDWRFDIGYRFGLLYGYGDDLINVGGLSVFAIALFGISYQRMGFDLGIVPVGIITASFRFDIDRSFTHD